MVPPRRYRDGLEIAEMDSQAEWGDSPEDKVIKRYFVRAKQNAHGAWMLVAFIEVEVIAIDNDGSDDGALIPGVETSRIPFPFDAKLRKALIRFLQSDPPFREV